MAAYVIPNKVRFKELPGSPTVLKWESAQSTSTFSTATPAPASELLISAMTLPFSIDSTGPSWRKITITAGANTWTFWQADINDVRPWVVANSTPTDQGPPF